MSNMGAIVGGSSAQLFHCPFFDSDQISAADNQGGSGLPTDSLVTTSVDITEILTDRVRITETGAFTNTLQGQWGYFAFSSVYASAFYEVLNVDGSGNFIDIDLEHISDSTQNLTCYLGGAVPVLGGGGVAGDMALQGVFDDTLGSAAINNVEIYMTGDATLTVNLDKDTGGGSASTMWHWFGCDSSYARITPTRTAISAGIANNLLDTSSMPTLTLNTNIQVAIPIDYIHIDGIFFDGDSTTGFGMVGGTAMDNAIISNCVIDNANTDAGSTPLVANNQCTLFNCDLIASGASGNTYSADIDAFSTVTSCIFVNNSSSASSFGLRLDNGLVSNCLFFDLNGIAIKYLGGNPITTSVQMCTFENVLTCIQTNDSNDTTIVGVIGNIAVNCTNFYDNPNASNDNILAQFNTIDTVTNPYINTNPASGFQELGDDDAVFVNEAGGDYNLQDTSPSKNSGALKQDRGAMSSEESGGAGGGLLTHPGMSGGTRG